MYLDPAGQGWTLELRDGRAVLVERFARMAVPVMVVNTWRAPGLRDYIGDDGKAPAITAARDGRLCIAVPYGVRYFERPSGADALVEQREEPIRPPRGKWRWSTLSGRWQHVARR